MHLAELNISSWKIDPEFGCGPGLYVDHVDAGERFWLNASPGFVWRLLDEQRDEQGGVTAVCAGPETVDDVCRSGKRPADLEHFVWNTAH